MNRTFTLRAIAERLIILALIVFCIDVGKGVLQNVPIELILSRVLSDVTLLGIVFLTLWYIPPKETS